MNVITIGYVIDSESEFIDYVAVITVYPQFAVFSADKQIVDAFDSEAVWSLSINEKEKK